MGWLSAHLLNRDGLAGPILTCGHESCGQYAAGNDASRTCAVRTDEAVTRGAARERG